MANTRISPERISECARDMAHELEFIRSKMIWRFESEFKMRVEQITDRFSLDYERYREMLLVQKENESDIAEYIADDIANIINMVVYGYEDGVDEE